MTSSVARKDVDLHQVDVFAFFNWVGLPFHERERVLCRDAEQDFWYPSYGGTGVIQTRRAKEICAGCELRESCLERAMEFEGTRCAQDRYGIWGGLTPRERAALARARAKR